MIYFAVTFVFMLIVIAVMAIGVIFGRQAIKGSCGGSGKGDCICTEKCEQRKQQEAQQRGDSAVINLELLEKTSNG